MISDSDGNFYRPVFSWYSASSVFYGKLQLPVLMVYCATSGLNAYSCYLQIEFKSELLIYTYRHLGTQCSFGKRMSVLTMLYAKYQGKIGLDFTDILIETIPDNTRIEFVVICI